MPDERLAHRFLDQAFSLWIEPELVRRGLPADRGQVRAALIVFLPGEGPAVQINDEAQIIASIQVRGPVEAGDPVTIEQVEAIESVYPAAVDPDAGWVCFVRVGNDVNIAFDFRRNRERASSLVSLGNAYLVTAQEAVKRELLGPAIENGFAGAELAVKAEMFLFADDPERSHGGRRKHWQQWAALGNVPKTHAETLAALGGARTSARYGDSSISLDAEDVRKHLGVVAEMLDHAVAAAGERLPDHGEAISRFVEGRDRET